jgi:hypothetical protein
MVEVVLVVDDVEVLDVVGVGARVVVVAATVVEVVVTTDVVAADSAPLLHAARRAPART